MMSGHTKCEGGQRLRRGLRQAGFSVLLTMAMFGCGSARLETQTGQQPKDNAASPTFDSGATVQATVVIGTAPVEVKTVSEPQQFAWQLSKLLPFDASRSKTLNAQEFASAVSAPPELTTIHSSAEMMLGLFTDESYTGPRPDGTNGPMIIDRPAWVLVVHGVTLVSSGPPDRPQITQVSAVVYVYDAASAAPVIEFSHVDGEVTCPLPAGQAPSRCGKG